jgi:hypothetical protein
MNHSSHRIPRMSRVKALIGTLAATAALAGVAEAAIPASASAMRSAGACAEYVYKGHFFEAGGNQKLADQYYDLYWACMG